MKFIILFAFAIIFRANGVHAQYIEDLGADQILGALAAGEIQLMNATERSISIEYSLDKTDWTKKSIGSKRGITATLNIKSSKWYVKVCNKNEQNATQCDQYPLLPKRRYVIDADQGKLVLRKTQE